jgi:hypothetical protein
LALQWRRGQPGGETSDGGADRRRRGGASVSNRERRKKILWVDLVVKRKKARGFL